MFCKVIVSSILLAGLANGLAIRRDTSSSSVLPLPTVTPQPILLPNSSVPLLLPVLPPVSLSLPPLDQSSIANPGGTLLPGPDPSISLSLPPLDQGSLVNPTGTVLPSVVTTTVYVYPTQCSPTPLGSLPTASPSGVPDDTISLPPPQDESLTLPPPAQPSPISLPDPQVSPLNVRRDDSDSVVSQLRALEQQVIDTWVGLGKGNSMLSVIGQLETLVAQAVAPGADGAAILKQAQSLVGDS